MIIDHILLLFQFLDIHSVYFDIKLMKTIFCSVDSKFNIVFIKKRKIKLFKRIFIMWLKMDTIFGLKSY